MGNYPCTLQQYDRVLSVYERTLPAEDPLRILAMGDKAVALYRLGGLAESLALHKAALKRARDSSSGPTIRRAPAFLPIAQIRSGWVGGSLRS